MADVVTTAYTIIFIGVLLLIGAVVFAYIADPMGDQLYVNETVIAAGCSSVGAASCTGTVDNPPIENITRAAPVAYNCSFTASNLSACIHIDTTRTVSPHTTAYVYNKSTGEIFIMNASYNGTIRVTYWEDAALTGADNAQQSITGVIYGGFDLATVMVIVMAAVGIISTIFLIGNRGA